MAVRFRTTFTEGLVGWLADGDGAAILFVLSYMLDGFAERMRQSLVARYPQYAVDNEAALRYLGADRGLPRGIRERADSYARRLVRFRGIRAHKTRGNGTTMAYQIADFLPVYEPGQEVDIEIHSTHAKTIALTYDAQGSDAAAVAYEAPTTYPDSLTGKARFYVNVSGYPGWAYNAETIGSPSLWGDCTVGGDGVVGFEGLTASDAAGVKAIIKFWKPAATYCDFVEIDGGRISVS